MTISLTKEAHNRITQTLHSGDIAIDATCGNGHDTVFLSKIVGPTGKVFAFDIQKQAIENTYLRLQQEELNNVELIHGCHSKILDISPKLDDKKVKAAMFNLGYLPGSDKKVITNTETTIIALGVVLDLMAVNSLLTVVVYPGHNGGEQEANAVFNWLKYLSKDSFKTEVLGNDVADSTPKLICLFKDYSVME